MVGGNVDAIPMICKTCYYFDEVSFCVIKGKSKPNQGFCRNWISKQEGRDREIENGKIGTW